MAELATSLHGCCYADTDFVGLAGVRIEVGVQVLELHYVLDHFFLAFDVGAKFLLLLDLLLDRSLLREGAGKVLAFLVLVSLAVVDFYPPGRSAGEVAGRAPVWPVEDVATVLHLEIFDGIRVDVSARLPDVVLGCVARPADEVTAVGNG